MQRRELLKAALAAPAVLTLTRSAFAQAQSVTIGYTGPLSGGAALYGKNCLNGLLLATEEANAAGGIDVGGKKVTVNLVPLDDKYAPSQAAVNAKRLSAQDKSPIVFCPHSGGIYALLEFNVAENFILSAYTSIPGVSERGNPLSFRMPPKFTGYVKPFVREQMKRFGKKLAIANADHDYAKAWGAVFDKGWKEAGGEVVAVNPMSYNKDTDFYSGVSRALAASPDVMLIGGASEPTALVAKQARELGYKGGFAIMDQAKMDEMALVLGGLDMLEGSIGVMPMVFDETPVAVKFVERYRKLNRGDPGSEVAFHYCGLNAVLSAMTLAGTTSDSKAIFAKLSDAFKGLSPDKNPLLISGLDEQGGAFFELSMAAVEKGKIVRVPA